MADQADQADAYNLLARSALTQLMTVARDNDLDTQLLVRRTLTHLQRHLQHAHRVDREQRERLGIHA